MVMGVASIAALLAFGPRSVQGQESPPDITMLLNLDLFASRDHATDTQDNQGGDSMVEQIRALNAMGYLRDTRANAKEEPPPADPNDSEQLPPGTLEIPGAVE